MPVWQDPDKRFSSHRSPQMKPESPDRHGQGFDPQTWAFSKLDFSRPPTSEVPILGGTSRISQIKETSNREELIQCIKRGEHPTWISSKHLNESPPYEGIKALDMPVTGTLPRTLLPAPHMDADQAQPMELALPSEIERPRSALHSGDFRENSPQTSTPPRRARQALSNPMTTAQGPLGSSPTTPWYVPSSTAPLRRNGTEPIREEQHSTEYRTRSRAPSLGSSLSSSFVYRHPTSPLVHAANNTDLDFSPRSDIASLSISADKTSRRRTLPPESFPVMHSSPQGSRNTNYSRPLPNLRRDNSLPYQAHQPRRSLTSIPIQDSLSSVTPLSRSRRPSVSSDFSPLQHASMVGSYEESILRGRMSTTPSKPLDFVAQIGVLGKGDCTAALRCPAHVTVPFPAVFYSYNSAIGKTSISDDSPSPYVGNIDLEHNLKPVQKKSSHRQSVQSNVTINDDIPMTDIAAPENTPIGRQLDRRKREKRRRRSVSPMAPSGGCYRIPRQGQLQIIIKNPNKTAVKLYLVPYDLQGMEPGTKTFIRQRSYSAGPVVEAPVSAAGSSPIPIFDKPILRYLIHLRICCPSKDRFYLYDNIRVVFANRVPDGKEKLRNEVQLPEPRYSNWKPNKEPPVIGSAGAKLAADKAYRRRSSGFGTGFGLGDIDGLGVGFNLPLSFEAKGPTPPAVPPLPPYPIESLLHSKRYIAATSGHGDQQMSDPHFPLTSRTPSSPDPIFSTIAGFNPPLSPTPPPTAAAPISSDSSDTGSSNSGPYAKLRRQEGRYGSSEGFHGRGLLAQRLKGLEMRKETDPDTQASPQNGEAMDESS